MRIVMSVLALVMAPAVAFAQADEAGAQESDAGLSELDLLSKTSDDPLTELSTPASRRPVTVTLRALNKITAKYTDITLSMGEAAKFGTLNILPRYCDKRPPEEFPETSAFLQVFDAGAKKLEASNAVVDDADVENAVDDSGRVKSVAISDDTTAAPAQAVDQNGLVRSGIELPAGEMIFSGWMFASSPALNPLEHAVYDVWVIDCETTSSEN